MQPGYEKTPENARSHGDRLVRRVSMKSKRIRNILHQVDVQTAMRIGEMCPPVDDRTKERIYTKSVKRAAQQEKTLPAADMVTGVMTEPTRHIRLRRFAMSAACIMTAAVTIWGVTMIHQTVPENETSEGQVSTAGSSDLTDNTITQEELYFLCMNQTADNLTRFGRVSGTIVSLTSNESCNFVLDFENDNYEAELISDDIHERFYWWYGVEMVTNNDDTHFFRYTDVSLLDPFLCPFPVIQYLVPRTLTLHLLYDFDRWKITSTDSSHAVRWESPSTDSMTINRAAYEVKGSTEDGYSFTIMIDKETGIWLSYQLEDENGNKLENCCISRLLIGDDVEQMQCPEPLLKYIEQDMSSCIED